MGTSKHETFKYITNPLYLLAIEKDTDRKILACVRREIYVINNLKAKMLIGNNILGPKKIVINIVGQKVYVGSYNTFTTIIAHQCGSFF